LVGIRWLTRLTRLAGAVAIPYVGPLDNDQLRAALSSVDSLEPQWRQWARHRPDAQVIHLDSGAAGRSSRSVLQATAEHATAESRWGAYVAAEQASTVLSGLRSAVGQLIGIQPDGVAWTDSAQTALTRLLSAWPFGPANTIGVLVSEWGPNLEAFRARGLEPSVLPADAAGRLDLEAFERRLRTTPPTVVHLTHVAAHRGLVQPIAGALALCREHGVPLWVDASQALGHVQTDWGADAVYATSRKWLAGPRGVGLLAIAEPYWPALKIARAAMSGEDVPPVQVLESGEANIAGRVGLAAAVQEYIGLGPAPVWQRLCEVGRMTRDVLAQARGWQVLDSDDASGAIVALRPTNGQDVSRTRLRLLTEQRVLTTASLPARAPLELRTPLLRISPHVDCTAAMLDHLPAGLAPTFTS
jgi:hercynylcysteine S-oxide lyase